MPPEPKRVKTEALSLRLDPKTKFILDFVARINGQSITTVVERAIKSSANEVRLGDRYDSRGNEIGQMTWGDFWDPSDGVRMLNLISNPDYPTNFEEDELRSFTLSHWQFFYTNQNGLESRTAFVDVLWPDVQKYLELWRTTKSTNYWAAGEAMHKALTAARIAPPEWPPKPKPVAPKKAAPDDLDDEIPF